MQQVPMPPAPAPEVVVMHGPGMTEAIVTVLVVLAAVLVLWPLVRALARRLEGRSGAGLQDELDDLRGRLEQVEQGQTRMAELEERLDFAERMLAQSREPDRLQR